MAEINTSNLMTIQGMWNVIDAADFEIDNIIYRSGQSTTEEMIDDVIKTLGSYINTLRNFEEKFCTDFNCNSKEEFKMSVKNYLNNNGYIAFTGSELRKIIDDYALMVEVDNMAFLEDLKIYINEAAQEISRSGIVSDYAGKLAQKVLGDISGEGFGKGGELTSRSFLQVNENQEIEILSSKITRAFREHFTSYRKMNKDQLKKIKKESTSSNGYNVSMNFGWEWYKITTKATKGRTGRGSDVKSDKELTKANRKITDLILSKIPGEAQDFARQKIINILDKDPKALFVGKSLTQLEGILWEISTYIALAHLLGDKYKPNIEQWIGSDVKAGSNNKQPSIDIAIRDIAGKTEGISYGFQIKNTLQELSETDPHLISFVNTDIETILKNGGINADSIKNLYVSKAFNVPYKLRGKKYVKIGINSSFTHGENSSFKDYKDAYNAEQRLINEVDTYLAKFAPDLLYMGINDEVESKLMSLSDQLKNTLHGNFVYIVSNEVYFASDMLEEIQKQVKQYQQLKKTIKNAALQLIPYLEKDKKEVNIVDVKNSGGVGVKASIKMKSAYGFKKQQ